ncbi:MAG: hypothetical protein R3179_08810, partial [Sedimenticolaceae bacterium]|nr:hypothetical protein [Sedimenticolaceae bacterium]
LARIRRRFAIRRIKKAEVAKVEWGRVFQEGVHRAVRENGRGGHQIDRTENWRRAATYNRRRQQEEAAES